MAGKIVSRGGEAAMPDDLHEQRQLGRYLAMGQAGLEMVVPIALGFYLDSRFGWSPWGVIVGAVLGISGGLYHLVRMADRANVDDAADRARRGQQ
jgi:hypothetical protein